MKISRTENWLRPLFIEDGKEIGNIVFYNEKGVICKVNQGWLEDDGKKYSVDTLSIELPDENLKRKNKKDFSKKENYYMSEGKDWDGRTKYTLYLYTNDYEDLGEEKQEMKPGYFYIYKKYRIQIKNYRLEHGEGKWFEDILLKFYIRSEKTEDREKEDKLVEELENKTGIKYLNMEKIKAIAEAYNQYQKENGSCYI